jgi:hypothetical protein
MGLGRIGQFIGIPVHTDGPVLGVFAVDIDVFKLVVIQGADFNVGVFKAVCAAFGLGLCCGDEFAVYALNCLLLGP